MYGDTVGGEWLFVYGTLMRDVGHPMHDLLAAESRFSERGWVRGALYDLGEYPGLVRSDRGRVWGEIYRLLHPRPLLARLDRYEACDPQPPHPHEYRRRLCVAVGESGRRYRVWCYLYNLDVSDDMAIRSGDYLRHIRRKKVSCKRVNGRF